MTIETTPSAREIVFVDSRVEDAGSLLHDLPPGAEIVFLKPAEDGLAQMAAALGERGDVSAVHILAHGSAGQLWLGGTFLDADTLAGQSEVLAAIGRGMTTDGDLLVYACDMAKGEAGAQFVANLAQLTGADVAASNNRTGASGDWQLEIRTGDVTALPVLAADATQQYHHDLATITVTSNADSGAGTLRNAITAATAGDTITFSAGMTVTMSSGKLTINKNLTIDGDLNDDGTADVTIDANYTSQVLQITTGTVLLDGLTLTHGSLSGAGGNANLGGTAALGAGISNAGTLTLQNTHVTANGAAGGGGDSRDYAGGGGGPLINGASMGTGASAGIGGGGTVGAGGNANGGSGPFSNMGGKGGASNGGTGGSGTDYATGGAGGTAVSGSLRVGGGGGGGGVSSSGHAGGAAVGGIYNASGATVSVIGSSLITNNVGAGGGGGGGNGTFYSASAGGIGGLGVGGYSTKVPSTSPAPILPP